MWTVCLLFVLSINSKVLSDDHFYTAGVVSYGTRLDLTSNDLQISADRFVAKNLREYLNFIEKAKNQKVDILVFPEATFNYFGSRQLMIEHSIELPNPDDRIAPYLYPDQYSSVLRNLSKHCRDYKIYILVNLVEKVQCGELDQCQRNDSYNLYNTNIVIDRYGRLISKYQKYHLFMEPNVEVPNSIQYSTFTTDFNVEFGHFICFDILFEKPAVNLVKLKNITNILYPSMWYSDLPFLTAVQIHSSWSYANQVNLLSAGANNPIVGSTGSGIYIGRISNEPNIMSPIQSKQLLIKKVPKDPRNYKKLPNINTNINKFTPNDMSKLNLAEVWSSFDNLKYDIPNNTTTKICSQQDQVCCTFHINWKKFDKPNDKLISYKYKLVVNSTTRLYGKQQYGGEIYCSIVACIDSKTCGKRFKSYEQYFTEFEFESIEIVAEMKNSNILMMPITLDTTILPLPTDQFEFTESSKKMKNSQQQQYTMKSNVNLKDILTFGILGRNYTADSPQ